MTEQVPYLVSETMEGSSKAVHACSKAQIGVGQGATHQVSRVGTHIASLVVTGTVAQHDGMEQWFNMMEWNSGST